jgi:hypothetical protein
MNLPDHPIRSRLQRKRGDRIARALGGDKKPLRRFGPIYWGPRNLSWLIGTSFMIGSACFAAGTISDNPNPALIVFFTGSIFFTLAGYGQYLQVINGDRGDGVDEPVRWFAWEPHLIEWQAAAIQFFGTLCFNVSTGFAMVQQFNAEQVHRFVWSPDLYGSIAFLVASWLAFKEVRDNWHGKPDRGSEWWVTVLNLVGSIAFGISAIGAYAIPQTGELLNEAASNAGTFVGALCFFAGAYLLWPEAEAALAEAT